MWIVLPSMSALALALCIIAFLITHGFAYWENRRKDVYNKPNIGTLMFYPYARVLPMWLTLTIGIHYAKDYSMTLILFLGLKTVADVFMQALEIENMRARNEKEPTIASRDEEYEKASDTAKTDPYQQEKPISRKEYLLALLKTRQGFLFFILITAFIILFFACLVSAAITAE